MKNRTVLGVICIALSVVIIFAVSPLMNRVTSGTVSVVRLKTDVAGGTKLTDKDLETVKVNKKALPKGVYKEKKEVVGRTAATNLYAGDFLTKAKLTVTASKDADTIFASLNGSKFAMSFTIDSFAAGLSGKLRNGDIISLVVKDKSGKTVLPKEFKYVKVVTTTTSGGVDQEKVKKNDDGTFTPPATVTLLVNETQARLLAEYEENTISCVLVYRGNAETANEFVKKQDSVFGEAK